MVLQEMSLCIQILFGLPNGLSNLLIILYYISNTLNKRNVFMLYVQWSLIKSYKFRDMRSYTKASWVILATDCGIGPERLLLLSLLKKSKLVGKKSQIYIITTWSWNDFFFNFIYFNKAYMYWRLDKWPKEEGISSVNRLSERSIVLSLFSLPISAGIGPVIWLFCNNLHQNHSLNTIKNMPIWQFQRFRIIWLKLTQFED